MAHRPWASGVTVDPEMVQTVGLPERKDTGRPEEAVALSGTATPASALPGGKKLIVCVCWTWIDRVAGTAAW